MYEVQEVINKIEIISQKVPIMYESADLSFYSLIDFYNTNPLLYQAFLDKVNFNAGQYIPVGKNQQN